MSKTASAAAKSLLILFTIFLFSCVSAENNYTSKESSSYQPKSESSMPEEIKNPYTEFTLKKSLVQFHEILSSYDYFSQFIWGDYIFEDCLTIIYGLESGQYEDGEGTEVSVYDNNGQVSEIIKRSVVESNGKEEIWWQTEHVKGEKVVFYELLTNRFSVPVSVHFRNPENGKAFSRDTMFGESVRDAALSMSEDEIRAKLTEERNEDAVNKLYPIYENIKELGIETIEAGERKLKAVHYSAVLSEAGGGTLDVWYSPDIPQGIIRIVKDGQVVAEITAWLTGAEKQITEENPDELPVYSTGTDDVIYESSSSYSEGTAADPVKLDFEEIWEGSVEPEGVSYYYFEVPYRGDVNCTVSGFEGLAELYYYGSDYSFTDWITGSEGSELDFQNYFAEKGDVIYFTINDIQDNYSEGDRYFIDISINPLLERDGILMINKYRENPHILKEGKNRLKVSGDEILYFLYKKRGSGNTEILIENYSSEDEIFNFIDAENSSYISAGGFEQDDGKKSITVEGLEDGAELYFYMVRKAELKSKKITIIVK